MNSTIIPIWSIRTVIENSKYVRSVKREDRSYDTEARSITEI